MEDRVVYTTDGKVRHYSTEEDINAKLAKIIGEPFIEYRKRWDAVNRMELETDFPLFLHLDMNQNCNLRCPHCIIGQPKYKGNYYEGKGLTWDEFTAIVDEGQKHKCPSISLQGNNEPLLLKDLERYIRYAREKGFIDIMINSNATLMTEDRAKSILEAGLTRIRFSIDAATADTYHKIRIGGNYDKVVTNINRFLELKKAGGYKLPVTGVSFCKLSENEHEVDEFFRQWQDKVDIVTIQTFIPPVLEGDFSHYYASDQLEKGESLEEFKCPQPFQRLVIRNRDITPCCSMFSTKLKMGEIGKTSVHDAWNSKEMKELRALQKRGEFYKNEICKKCVLLTYPQQSDD